MKKFILAILVILIPVNLCFAITLLSEQEALKRFFSGEEKIIPQKFTATQDQLKEIRRLLGGRLVDEISNEYSKKIDSVSEWVFYVVKRNNRLIGSAIILDEVGKWGPIRFIVNLSPEGTIRDTAVMRYSETRGRPIASNNFLRQFAGKNINDPLQLDNDIQGVAGATVSSQAACFVMRKAMVLYKVLILNQKEK